MIVAPHIRTAERLPGVDGRSGIRIDLSVPAGLHYLEGHFPACPLLPGVVQLTWAIELAKQHLPIAGQFHGVSALKFMRVIQPGEPVSLLLNFDTAKRQLTFEYRSAGGVCASGAVSFAAS